jgi:pimeloyl-ACP methyl ester carboxylesterase
VAADLLVRDGGVGEPVLLLVYGLGATGDVWGRWVPLLTERWPGRWLAPDLPGHGGSGTLPGYSFGARRAAWPGSSAAWNGWSCSGTPWVASSA